MNTKKAEALLAKAGLEVIKWNKTFTCADVKTASGLFYKIATTGGKDVLEKRVAVFVESLKALPPTDPAP